MEKSNSHKKKRIAFNSDKGFSSWTAVFEPAVSLCAASFANIFLWEKKMKKVLAVAILTCLSLGFVFANEGDENSFGKPSFEIKNTLGAKGMTNKFGMVEYGKIEDILEAKFAVCFDINKKISITPFLSNKTSFKSLQGEYIGWLPVDSNIFKLGLELDFTLIEMLGISVKSGYLTDFSVNNLENSGNINTNGFLLGAGMDLNIEKLFITAKLDYDLKAKFNSTRYREEEKAVIKYNYFEHTIDSKFLFDFFNFIKDGINSQV